MAELSNCPNCGQLFVKALRPVCDKCAREAEEKFDAVYRFIRKRENRSASMDEVHDSTGVEKDLIIQWIREGRLRVSQMPNMGIPCEHCGKTISEGKLCDSCRSKLTGELKQGDKEKQFEDRKKQKERERYTTYSTLEDKVRRDR